MTIIRNILQQILKLLQTHFNVGHPLNHFCLLRCLDVISPAMLIQRPRSKLEVGLKTFGLCIMLTYTMTLAYDFSQQPDVRAAMDIFCMLSLFSSIVARSTCLRQYQPHINALERLDANPQFRVGIPSAEQIRRKVAMENNRFFGTALVYHFLTVTLYVWQNMWVENSFVTIITYAPVDLSQYSPTLDRLAQLFYCLSAYVWAWYYAAGQLTVIISLRLAISEFRVFLHSLATLDDQIKERLASDQTNAGEEQIVRELLQEHARRHSQLIVVMMHLRMTLYIYSLVHFSFYMTIVAAFMTRVLIIPGSSSLGMAIPLLVTIIFFFETLALCLLVENLVLLNREVGIVLYGFDWTRYLRYGRSIKRTMMLMIMQANNTRDVSAGGLTTVSAELFAKTCRIVYTMIMGMANLAT
uniref:Odorant receptor n=1 Tax=Anopheles farauti TaxID=69004 RepID=A0A182QPQ3_9DIPT